MKQPNGAASVEAVEDFDNVKDGSQDGQKPIAIYIEGCIGVGKSEFIRRLQASIPELKKRISAILGKDDPIIDIQLDLGKLLLVIHVGDLDGDPFGYEDILPLHRNQAKLYDVIAVMEIPRIDMVLIDVGLILTDHDIQIQQIV